jgi:hypothetical protein
MVLNNQTNELQFKMDRVFTELQMTIPVEDPCAYAFDKRISNSVIEKHHRGLISFFIGSWADKNIDKNYWIKIDYHFLPKKYGGTELVWYEFTGKHYQIVI